MRLTSSELASAKLVWLVEFRLRGELYHFSTTEQAVPDGAATRQYRGTLRPIVHPDESSPWDGGIAERSVEVAVIFEGLGFASITSTDHDIGDATCEVSLWRVGDDYSKREVIIDGFVDEPTYSGPDELVAFSVRESPLLDTGRTLSPLATVNQETFPGGLRTFDPDVEGQPYPVPFGRPGALVGGITDHHGSPALLVAVDAAELSNVTLSATVIIGDGGLSCAGGTVLLQNMTAHDPQDIVGEVVGVGDLIPSYSFSGTLKHYPVAPLSDIVFTYTNVSAQKKRATIFGDDTLGGDAAAGSVLNRTTGAYTLVVGGAAPVNAGDILGQYTAASQASGQTATVTAFKDRDGLGRLATFAFVTRSDMRVSAGDELWVSFRTTGAGGVQAFQPAPFTGPGGVMSGAGDVLAWVLGRSTLRVDSEQLRGSVRTLNGYELDFARNQDQSAWEMALDIIRELPASFVLGPRGLQLIHWRLDALASDAVAHLDTANEMGDLSGTVNRSSRDAVANVLSIDYAYDPQIGKHRHRLVYGPALWPDAIAGYTEHPLCSASFTRYRDTQGRPIEASVLSSQFIQDPATAAAVLQAEAMRRCGTHTEATFSGLGQKWQALSPGDVVTVSHEPVGWADEVCLVTRVDRKPGDTSISFLRPNNWIRDALA